MHIWAHSDQAITFPCNKAQQSDKHILYWYKYPEQTILKSYGNFGQTLSPNETFPTILVPKFQEERIPFWGRIPEITVVISYFVWYAK
jgi:hypothetical protein